MYQSLSRFTRWSCVGLQAASLALAYGFASEVALIVVLAIIGMVIGILPLTIGVAGLIALVFFSHPLMMGATIMMKWLVVGRYKPGSYPLWGFYYFRWWLVTRMQMICGSNRYNGTPLLNVYYRLMGAKVGKNCIIDTDQCDVFDLITIGDDSCIGSETHILGCRMEDGMLHIGTVEIGNRCFIGTQCCLGLNTVMEDDCKLDDLSLLPDGADESRRIPPRFSRAAGRSRRARNLRRTGRSQASRFVRLSALSGQRDRGRIDPADAHADVDNHLAGVPVGWIAGRSFVGDPRDTGGNDSLLPAGRIYPVADPPPH